MKQSENKKNIVIVTHKFVTHPDDELFAYLNMNKYANVMQICHSFYEAPNRQSYYKWYSYGNLIKQESSLDFKNLPEPIIYVKEFFYTIKYIFTSGLKWDIYIGMDGLCTMFGNFLRNIKRVKKTVFWAIDFVPHSRFKEEYKNKIYQFINIHGYKNSDEMWDLSPRMADARKHYLGIDKNIYKMQKVVPFGMWTQKIKKYTYKQCEQNTIVFMGRILENQGAQLIMKALPQLIKKNKNIIYKIIGTGPYKEELIRFSKELKVERNCKFLGRIEDPRDMENEIAKSCVAVAPYNKKLDKWTYYADPGKVKTYLACGVPVLLTDLPWNATDIEKNQCGIIIKETTESIIKNLYSLMKEKQNQDYRNNAITYSKKFDYTSIFVNLNL